MLPEKTIIIHGWSDCSESFIKLKKTLAEKQINSLEDILYGDYESREDNLTFNDIVDGLNEQFVLRGIVDKNGEKLCNLNVIVHSTGGLVIRHWLWRYYLKDNKNIETCPVKRIVMLAPANFGSPLAHRGKSFLGSLFKGRWKFGDFLESGRQILDGLELGSPYQWELAHKDLIIDSPAYQPDKIQVTILVGLNDYQGVKGWVNKPGTDGTVVISGTNLNSIKLTLDFNSKENPFNWSQKDNYTNIAYGVLKDLDHGTIVANLGNSSTDNEVLTTTVINALQTKDKNDFLKLQEQLKSLTDKNYAETGKQKFQHFIVRAVDDQECPVNDFMLEFDLVHTDNIHGHLANQDKITELENKFSMDINKIFTEEIHTHTLNPSYRRFLVNLDEMHKKITEAKKAIGGDVAVVMKISIPDIDQNIAYNKENLNNISVYRTDSKQAVDLFFPNTTTLIELQVDRVVKNYVIVSPNQRVH